MNSLEIAKIAKDSLEDKIAQDIKILDLNGLSNIADYFVIASGNNINHLRAMADDIEMKLGEVGEKTHHTEGYSGGQWILLDYNNVLIHLFDKEQREFYGIENVWRDAKVVE